MCGFETDFCEPGPLISLRRPVGVLATVSTMIRVPTNRGELSAEVYGPADADPVLLVTGGGGAMWSWSRILPEAWPAAFGSVADLAPVRSLADDMRVAVYDQAGVGLSSSVPPAGSTSEAAADALAVGRALLGERFSVVGMSLGGAVAIRCALDSPNTIERLVLICTYPSASTLVASPGEAQSDSEPSVADQVRQSLQPGFAEKHPGLVDAVVTAAVALELHEDLNERSIELFFSHDGHDLGEIAAPTTVVCGAADTVFSLENSTEIARLIPNSQLIRIEGAGHPLHIEAPHELANAVRNRESASPSE